MTPSKTAAAREAADAPSSPVSAQTVQFTPARTPAPAPAPQPVAAASGSAGASRSGRARADADGRQAQADGRNAVRHARRRAADRARARLRLVAERRPLRHDRQFLCRRAEGADHSAGDRAHRRGPRDRGAEGQDRRPAVRHRSRALHDRARARQGPARRGQGRVRQSQVLVCEQSGSDQDGPGFGQGPAGRLRPEERTGHARRRNERRPRHRPWPPSSRPSRSSNSSATSRRRRWSSSAAASTRRSTTFPNTSRRRPASRTRSATCATPKILAPIDGVATQVTQIELGRVAPAGQPVFAVVADKGLWVDANPKESDMTYVRAGQPATVTVDAFPGPGLERNDLLDRAGHRRAVLDPAAAERQRQLGQGRPAGAPALLLRPERGHEQPARRHERLSVDRHRPRADAEGRSVRPRRFGGRRPRASRRREGRARRNEPAAVRDHRADRAMDADRLHHDGDGHAGARHDHRQCRPALYAGLAVDDPGPGQLGADLLHRRRRDHDLAARLDGDALRAQEAVHRLHRRLHRRLDAVRRRAVDRADGRLPPAAGRVRRGAGAAQPGGDARHLSAGAARLGDGDLGHGRHARADHGADARRLADRLLFVALGVLRQSALRHPDDRRALDFHGGDADPPRRAVLLVRLPQPVARHRRLADDARPRAGARLVRTRPRSSSRPFSRSSASTSSSSTARRRSGRS